jgi:hypothetical protein
MIGSASIPSLKTIQTQIPNVGMLFQPTTLRIPRCVYACDNGVYAAWTKERVWDQKMHTDYLNMLNRLPCDNPPKWVLLPDAVADWPRTRELASIYLPILRQRGYLVALALQDGCCFEEVLEISPDWVFVAGSTQWKEANILPICEFFKPRGIRVHVGRVNTKRRLVLCQSSGVDSVDGTTLNKFRNISLPVISSAMKQGCLQMWNTEEIQ